MSNEGIQPAGSGATLLTVRNLLNSSPGTNFYRELQLVFSVALLEISAAEGATLPATFEALASLSPGPSLTEQYRTVILYSLLLLVDEAPSVENFFESISPLAKHSSGVATELLTASGFGGGGIFAKLRTFMYSGGRSLTFVDYRSGQEDQVSGEDALKALRSELRVRFADPIFALGAYLRSAYSSEQNRCEKRFGDRLAHPMERVELRGEMGGNFGKPGDRVPYPRLPRS